MQNSILLLFLLSLTVSTTFAQAPAQAPIGAVSVREAIVHQELARAYVAKKNWPKAREEAKLATSKAPNSELNRDSWLILAAVEERLENFSEANTAYAKYLALNPPAKKKAIVQTRLTELETKVDQYKRYKWGPRSSALLLGRSSGFKSATSEQIDGDMSSAMDIGLQFSGIIFGFKKGVGKAGAFQAPTTTDVNPPYGAVAAGSRHVVEEGYFQTNIELTKDSDRSMMVFSIPIYIAGVISSIRTEGTPEELYLSYGMDVASGLSVSLYTKSAISFDLGYYYHLGLPFGPMQSSNDRAPIKTVSGEEVSGSTTGGELRLGIKILFGATPPGED